MFMINTLQSTLSGDELMASVLASHAAHIPTQQAIAALNSKVRTNIANPTVNNHTPSAVPKRVSAPSHRPDSANEICRLFGEGNAADNGSSPTVRTEHIGALDANGSTIAAQVTPRNTWPLSFLTRWLKNLYHEE